MACLDVVGDDVLPLAGLVWASAHDRPRMSVRKRSARRWRRTTGSASREPAVGQADRAVDVDQSLVLHAPDHLRDRGPGDTPGGRRCGPGSRRRRPRATRRSPRSTPRTPGGYSGVWYSATPTECTTDAARHRMLLRRRSKTCDRFAHERAGGLVRAGQRCHTWSVSSVSSPLSTAFPSPCGPGSRPRSPSPPRPRRRAGRPSPRGEHTLILAPTGSGKTLAAFLWGIDRLVTAPPPDESPAAPGCSTSRRCGRWPSTSRRTCGRRCRASAWPPSGSGVAVHEPTVGMRTGDTPADERRTLVRHPPDLLITTPESLYLMLTSAARETLRGVEAVIIDEIHALAATKRGRPPGAHPRAARQARCERPPAAHRPVGHAAAARGDRPLPRRLRRARRRRPRRRGRSRSSTPACASRSRSRWSCRSTTWASWAQVIEEPTAGPAAAGPVRRSIWPAMHPRLLELVQEHRSTLIFVNARRLAERLATRLNELPLQAGENRRVGRGRRARRRAGVELVKAHHGSLSRERRLQIEDELKSGRLKGLVATSVARARHRHGRGRPRHPGRVARRGVHAACSASAGPATRSASRAGASSSRSTGPTSSRPPSSCERMHDGLIEHTRYPRNPLDVLAQQIVAMCALDEWTVDELAALVRRAANFADLSDDVLRIGARPAGRAATRPRSSPSCGRASCGTGSRASSAGRAGAQRLAVTSGGTIPDRGLFGVFLPDGTRVGELDEEMVYESRPGRDVPARRVHLAHRGHHLRAGRSSRRRPGQPGKMPFWHGDGPGRPLELGRAVGEFVRERAGRAADAGARARCSDAARPRPAGRRRTSSPTSTSRPRPPARCPTTARSSSSASATRSATGGSACCRRSAPRCTRRGPWRCRRRLAERWGMDVEMMWSDDGIVLRLPEAVDELPDRRAAHRPRRDRRASSSASSRARRCSPRGSASARPGPCCCPGAGPTGARRCGSSASGRPTCWPWRPSTRRSRSCSRPPASASTTCSTCRRCARCCATCGSRKVRVVAGRHAAGVAVRPVAAVRLDRRLHVRGRRPAGRAPGRRPRARPRPAARPARRRGAARAASTPRCWPTSSSSCSAWSRAAGPAIADELHDLLRAARPADSSTSSGPLRSCRRPGARVEATGPTSCGDGARGSSGWAIAGEERFAAAEDAGPAARRARVRRSRSGLPGAFTDPVDDPLRRPRRPLRPHPRPVPRRSRRPARFGVDVEPGRAARSSALEADGRVVRGEFRPDGVEREWCDDDVLRQLRRRSLAALRKEVEPVDAAALARFLPALAGRRAAAAGASTGWSRCSACCQGRRIAGVGARGRRPAGAACPATGRPTSTRCARRVSWCGSAPAPLGATDGRVRLVFRDQVGAPACPPTSGPRGPSPLHAALRDHLADARAPPSGPTSLRAAAAGRPAVRRRRGAGRAVGSRVGGRGHQRLARPAACLRRRAGSPAARGARRRTPRGRPRPGRLTRVGPAGRRRAVVARRTARLRCRSRRAHAHRGGPRPGPAAARALRRAHPRGGARRGHRGRVRRRVPRAQGARGARSRCAVATSSPGSGRPSSPCRARSTACGPLARRRRRTTRSGALR